MDLRRSTEGRGQIAPSGEVFVTMRSALEGRFLSLAREHARQSKAAAEAGDHSRELDDALRAIILAAGCLEAFINAAHLQAGGEPFPESDRTPTVRKWIDVTRNISRGRTFAEDSEVVEGLKWLFGLRNYLLHYKAGFEPPVQTKKVTSAQHRLA